LIVDGGDCPARFVAYIRTYHVWMARPVGRTDVTLPTVTLPAIVANVLLELHWTM
jgi:hypothetical protein